jgi:hypothetical protein
MENFSKVAPYLKNPLVLVGFVDKKFARFWNAIVGILAVVNIYGAATLCSYHTQNTCDRLPTRRLSGWSGLTPSTTAGWPTRA